MPTYEYECENCGIFELQQKMTEEPLKTCPGVGCGKSVKRILSAVPVHFKGSGFFSTDYKPAPKRDKVEKPSS